VILESLQAETPGCWGRGWTRGRVGQRCGDCDCGARGLRGLGGWIWGIRLQAPRGPALRVRDSVAAAAAWLDTARYSDTGGICQRYTPGGCFVVERARVRRHDGPLCSKLVAAISSSICIAVVSVSGVGVIVLSVRADGRRGGEAGRPS